MMITTKCPKCKKEAALDDSLEFMFCKYCGEKITIDSCKKNIGTQNPFQAIYDEIDAGKTQSGQSAIASKNRKLGLSILSLVIVLSIIGVIVFLLLVRSNECFRGHTWVEATCKRPEYCAVCGIERGVEKEHTWSEATCIKPRTCSVCYLQQGSANGHSYDAATCTSPAKCRICGYVNGTQKDHVLVDYICVNCGETVISKEDVPNILDITSARYEMDYLGGITQKITATNKSSNKTINYITYKMEFLNAVGDVIPDQLGLLDYASLKYTGPLEPGKSSGERNWPGCYYNSTFSGTIHFLEIKIEYSDGTTLVLDESVARYAVVDWRN